MFEPARLAINGWRLVGPRVKQPEAVLVLPGFSTGDISTVPLRGYLASFGHHVHGWGLGTNRGDVEGAVATLIPRVRRLADQHGRPVSLIGWSLGGVMAREICRQVPGSVGRVITMGTPVVGGPKYTVLAEMFARGGADLDELEREVARRQPLPPNIPVTAFYSRHDGVVAWRACIDHLNSHVEHIEIQTTHIGFGINHEVWRIIADRLAGR